MRTSSWASAITLDPEGLHALAVPPILLCSITIEPRKGFVFISRTFHTYADFQVLYVQLTETEYPDLAKLNQELARSLRSLHEPALDHHAQRIEHCVHSLTRPDDISYYCRSKLCLECRRWRAIDERKDLLRRLGATLSTEPAPLMFFQTLTVQDCTPDEIESRATALVKGFAKLRRKLPHHKGWVRVIETKTADLDNESENVHMHFVMIFPPGQRENVDAIAWNSLWSKCAGDLARSTDPLARYAEVPQAVINYLTKGFDWDYAEDGKVGAENPQRYIQRVVNGHARFSGGGLLRLTLNIDTADPTGLSQFWPRSTIRNRRRHPPREEPEPIFTEE